MTDLAAINDDPLPFTMHLGIRVTAAEAERVVAELAIRDAFRIRPAVVHGGLLMAFADTLGGVATALNLPEGHGTTTIESKTNFLAAAPVGTTITGETTPVHRGRATMVWRTRITAASGRLVAIVTHTQLALAPRE